MSRLRVITGLSATALLAACGGGSSGGSGSSYAAQLSSFEAEFGSASFTPAASLPSGNATYRGVAAFNTTNLDDIDFPDEPPTLDDALALADDIEGYIGALTLNVEFGGGTLSGSVRNFEDLDGRSANGQIAIRNGSVTAASNAAIAGGYNAEASGTIAGEAYAFDVDGNFLGDSGDGVSIYFSGSGDTDAIGVGFGSR